MDPAMIRVREAERRFLQCFWWVFPATGLVGVMLTGGGFWAWVSGNRPWLDWHRLWSWRAVAICVGGWAIVALWRGFLWRRMAPWGAIALVLAGLACAECAVRLPTVQAAFWLAARSRGYLPEVCYIRLEEAEGRSAEDGAVILVGSSQMVHGVDVQLLKEILAPRDVIRRVCSGMWAQAMLAMWGRIPFRAGDVCVQIRSAFDFLEKPEFDADWFRPLASPSGWSAVFRTAGWQIAAKHWRQGVDYTLAAFSECWRMRDGAIAIGRSFWKGERKPPLPGGAGWTERELEWSDWQWRAFEEAAERLEDAGVAFLVFEGDVNPAMQTKGLQDKHGEFLQRMEDGEREGKWVFIPLEEQDAGIGEGDWVDMAHVNAAGCEKLTRAVGRVVREKCMVERNRTLAGGAE